MNAGNSFTYKNAKIETTQWEDILVEKGIATERTELTLQRMVDEEIKNRVEAEKETTEERLGKLSLDEMAEVEDDEDEDILEKLRRQRIQQLKQQAKNEIFGGVYPMVRSEFVKEVTEASKKHWVVCELFQTGVEDSLLMSQLLRQVAEKRRAVKFVRILSTDCVENWPDSRVPCLLVYHEGVMKFELVGLSHCGGKSATVDSLDESLKSRGVYRSEYDDGEDVVKSKYIEEQDDEEEDAEEDELNGGYIASAVTRRRDFDDEDDADLDN